MKWIGLDWIGAVRYGTWIDLCCIALHCIGIGITRGQGLECTIGCMYPGISTCYIQLLFIFLSFRSFVQSLVHSGGIGDEK